MLVLMAGLPGTGKSTLARELALELSGTVLNKDDIRSVLFEPRDVEYSTRQDDFVMEILLQTAGYLLQKDPARVVLIDGRPFSRSDQIDRVKAFAAGLGLPWRILECICSEATARQRLQQQSAAGEHPAANRNFELYLDVKARFELIPPPKTIIDTDAPLASCVNLSRKALL